MVLAVGVLILCTATVVGAQDLRVRIEIEHLIGEEDDADPEYLLQGPHIFAVDAAGNLYVGEGYRQSIRVYSPEGDYLRTLGSPGRGPGEFALIRSVIPMEDGGVAITDTENAKVSLFGPAGRLQDEFRLFDEGMIHPKHWTRLGDSEIILFYAGPGDRAKGDMFHVYSGDLKREIESFGLAKEIWDQDSEWQVHQTGMHFSAYVAAPSSNRACAVPATYEGEIICFDRGSDGWERVELHGKEIRDPYTIIHPDDAIVNGSLIRRGAIWSGPAGRFAAIVHSRSKGITGLEDGSLLHFSTQVNAWEEKILYAELFAPDGSLVGWGPVRGYPAEKIDEKFSTIFLWYLGGGRFYMADQQKGYPVIREARITIDGHDHVFVD